MMARSLERIEIFAIRKIIEKIRKIQILLYFATEKLCSNIFSHLFPKNDRIFL